MSNKKALLFLGSKSNSLYLFIKEKLYQEFHLSKILDDDGVKEKVTKIFAENKNFKLQIFLDGAEQFYHLKTYPNVSKSSVKKMISRDRGKHQHSNKKDEEHLIEGEIIFHDNEIKCWNHVAISSSLEEDITSWINFFLEISGLQVEGIYNAPVEYESLLSKIIAHEKTEHEKKTKKKDFKEKRINILFFRTKTNNLRQIIFYRRKIIFTRLVSYDLGKSFLKDFKSDLDRMIEYLARMVGSVEPKDIRVISIFPDSVCQKMKTTQRDDVKYEYFTRSAIGDIVQNKTESSGYNSDKVLAIALLKCKKRILPLEYGKITLLRKLTKISNALAYVSLFLVFSLALFFNIFYSQKNAKHKELKEIVMKKLKHSEALKNIYSSAKSSNSDSGAVLIRNYGDVIKKIKGDENFFIRLVDKNSFLTSTNIVTDKILFKDFWVERLFTKALISTNKTKKKKKSRKKSLSKKTKVNAGMSISFFGKLKIPSGDINDGLGSFDKFSINLKKSFSEYKIKKSEIPSNLKFNQKYFEIPVNFNLSK
jgi:hypothetical protein